MLVLQAVSGPLVGWVKTAIDGEGASPHPCRGRDVLRIPSFNVNGMSVESKRKGVMEGLKKGRLDVIGLQEMHMRRCGIMECVGGNECEIWEGMEGGVVWHGVDEKSRGRGKEGCALLLSPRVWKGIEAHGWRGSKIVWAVGKLGIVNYAWVCIHALVNASNGREREMRKFWNDVSE